MVPMITTIAAVTAVILCTQQDAPQLPPGMTPQMMEDMMKAATPGEMHAWLAKDVGTWKGTYKNYPAPGAPPVEGPVDMTVKPMLDGRFMECSVTMPMPGMGEFHGMGTVGYDNAQGKFQATWMDNMGTGIMYGTGELSADRKTFTVTYNFYCPVRKCQSTMREVLIRESDNHQVMKMYGPDMVNGKEYMMMEASYDRVPAAPAAKPAAPAKTAAPATKPAGR